MSSTFRWVYILLAVFTIVSIVSANRLSDAAKYRGFNEKIVKKRASGNAPAAPRVKRETTTSTSSVCTTAAPPNPTNP